MRILYFLLVLVLFTSPAIGQHPVNTDKNNIALEGYDPVSYFDGVPQKGSPKFSSKIKGITYYFSTAEHSALFETSPEKYTPEYGGYCAYAMAKNGDLVGIDPKSYLIIDEKLYLFYDSWGIDTRKKWLKGDSHGQIKSANNFWTTKRQ